MSRLSQNPPTLPLSIPKQTLVREMSAMRSLADRLTPLPYVRDVPQADVGCTRDEPNAQVTTVYDVRSRGGSRRKAEGVPVGVTNRMPSRRSEFETGRAISRHSDEGLTLRPEVLLLACFWGSSVEA